VLLVFSEVVGVGWGCVDGSVKPVCMVVSDSFSSKVLSKLATYNMTSVLFICSTCERFTMETYKVNSSSSPATTTNAMPSHALEKVTQEIATEGQRI